MKLIRPYVNKRNVIKAFILLSFNIRYFLQFLSCSIYSTQCGMTFSCSLMFRKLVLNNLNLNIFSFWKNSVEPTC